MPDLVEVVADYASRVAGYSQAMESYKKSQLLVQALRAVDEALGSSGDLTLGAYGTIPASAFSEKSLEVANAASNPEQERLALDELTVDVATFVKYNQLPEDDMVTAQHALTAWENAPKQGKAQAQRR